MNRYRIITIIVECVCLFSVLIALLLGWVIGQMFADSKPGPVIIAHIPITFSEAPSNGGYGEVGPFIEQAFVTEV